MQNAKMNSWPSVSAACVLWISALCNLQAAPDYFPLEKGNYWIYRGETKFLVKNPETGKNEPKSEMLTWKMEVVDTTTGVLLIDAPLMEGKVFGGDLGNRARGRYCWLVEGEAGFDPKQFPAAGKLSNPSDFIIVYRAAPEHQILDFVPGLGIVGFQYVHHGTLSETNLGLIEFGKANR